MATVAVRSSAPAPKCEEYVAVQSTDLTPSFNASETDVQPLILTNNNPKNIILVIYLLSLIIYYVTSLTGLSSINLKRPV